MECEHGQDDGSVRKLRVLIVENSEDDFKLLVRALAREGFKVAPQRVDTAPAMQAALDTGGWDIILSDHSMPEFSALAALDILKHSGVDVPFIIVSGRIGDDVAIEAMKAGAQDYIEKHNLSRLVPAITRELREATGRQERRLADEALRLAYAELETRVEQRTTELSRANKELLVEVAERQRAERMAQDARAYAETIVDTVREPLLVLSADLRVRTANRSFYQTFQVSPDQTVGHLVYELGNAEWDIPRLRELLGDILPGNTHFEGFEVEQDFSRIGHKTMLLNARRLMPGDRPQLILLAIEDITERKRAEQFREQYTSLIAHDLRSPLTVIMGMADLLHRVLANRGMEREASTVDRILSGGRRMESMIRDLIAMARLEAGQIILHKEPTDLRQLIDDIRSRVGTAEDARRIEVKAPEYVPPALADPGQLERAVVNLISNALKYSPEDKPVVIDISREGAEAILSVTDQGAGIPEVERSRLFERFYRTSTRGQHEGLGLGLYITRLIVEAHGGRVSVESNVGKGSTFSLMLPLT